MITIKKNDDNQVFFVKIEYDPETAKKFLYNMWKSVDDLNFPLEENALGEWTDRLRCVRSIYNSYEICIYTHGHHPQDDKKELHPLILEFLKRDGILV